jgi:hypothetical protein
MAVTVTNYVTNASRSSGAPTGRLGTVTTAPHRPVPAPTVPASSIPRPDTEPAVGWSRRRMPGTAGAGTATVGATAVTVLMPAYRAGARQLASRSVPDLSGQGNREAAPGRSCRVSLPVGQAAAATSTGVATADRARGRLRCGIVDPLHGRPGSLKPDCSAGGLHTVTGRLVGCRLIKVHHPPLVGNTQERANGGVGRFIKPGLSGDNRQGDINAASPRQLARLATAELGEQRPPVRADRVRRDVRPCSRRPPDGRQLPRRDHARHLTAGNPEILQVVGGLTGRPRLARCVFLNHIRPLLDASAPTRPNWTISAEPGHANTTHPRNAQRCQSDHQDGTL